MLELIREFALEHLHEHGEYAAARQAHAQHFLNRLQASGSTWARHLHGFPGQEVVRSELDNIRSAFDWFESLRDAGKCAQLGDAVWEPYYVDGLFRETLSLGKRVLYLTEDQPVSDALLATTLSNLGVTLSVLGDHDAAVSYALQGVDLARKLAPETGLLPLALIQLAIAWRDQRQFGEAMVHAEEALPAARADAVDEYIEPHVLYHLGRLAYLQGDLDRAESCLTESLNQIRMLGPTETALYTINTLAEVHTRLGNLAEAARLLRESYLLLPPGGFSGFWFDSTVMLAAQVGFPALAVRMLGFYSAYYASIGVEEIPVDPRLAMVINRLRDELGADEFDAAYRGGSLLTSAEAEAIAFGVLDGVEQG